MIKYLPLLAILFLSSFSVSAEEGSEKEMQPQIGSMNDSGRVDPDEYTFSNAENKLWMDKHLSNIEQPVRLHYEFEKTGSYEDGFIDDVYLDIIKINEDGSKNAALQFFTEERSQKVLPSNVENITSNPVIGIYMQGDVYEMSRLTDGGWKYFHRQIKLAIASNEKSEAVTIEIDGKTYHGEKITLYPYEKISKKGRLKEFSDKRYDFILSEEVPGKLYQIKTVMNDPEDPEIPLMVETLTLVNVEFSSEVVAKKEN